MSRNCLMCFIRPVSRFVICTDGGKYSHSCCYIDFSLMTWEPLNFQEKEEVSVLVIIKMKLITFCGVSHRVFVL